MSSVLFNDAWLQYADIRHHIRHHKSFNLQITRSDTRPHMKWAISLVNADGHSSLPQGFVWVRIGEHTHFIPPEGSSTQALTETCNCCTTDHPDYTITLSTADKLTTTCQHLDIGYVPSGGLCCDPGLCDGPGVALPELVGVADLDTGVLGFSC